MLRLGAWIVVWVGSLIHVSIAAGQCPAEDRKLLASDGSAGKNFGFVIAMEGQAAVIGAPRDATNGANAGAAYVFKLSGGSWQQTAKLLASDGQAGNAFGSSVGISGNRIVVGAVDDNDAGGSSGSAYIFEDTGSWTQTQKLTAADAAAGDRFGGAVAISGGVIVIGALTDDHIGSDSGSAYVFEFSGSSFTQFAKLSPIDAAASNLFGASVAVQGTRAVVGARAGDGAVSNSGSVYVFQRGGTVWNETAELTSGDAVTGDQFGHSVALDGNTVLVGARFGDGPAADTGSAYVFDFNGVSWTQTTELVGLDLIAPDQFGTSVALQGATALVGAPRHDGAGSDAGAAYRYVNTGTWGAAAKLTAADAGIGNVFGSAVGVGGVHGLVGAYFDDDQGGLSGSAYSFYIGDHHPCDANCDGSINPFDINDFLSILGGSSSCSPCAGDVDANGTVNPFDINGFLACLLP